MHEEYRGKQARPMSKAVWRLRTAAAAGHMGYLAKSGVQHTALRVIGGAVSGQTCALISLEGVSADPVLQKPVVVAFMYALSVCVVLNGCP
jgi:hypothetical protein